MNYNNYSNKKVEFTQRQVPFFPPEPPEFPGRPPQDTMEERMREDQRRRDEDRMREDQRRRDEERMREDQGRPPVGPPQGRPPQGRPPEGRPPVGPPITFPGGPPQGLPPNFQARPPVGPPPELPRNVPRPPRFEERAFRPEFPMPPIVFWQNDPRHLRRCIYRYTYIWLRNGANFWFVPIFVTDSVAIGFRWRATGWDYFVLNFRRISYFHCF